MAVWLSLSLSQGTPNESARTTTVSATLTIHYDNGSYDGTEPSGEITIDGQSFPFVKNFNYAGYQQGPATMGTGSTSITVTATVPYGSSSTRTVSASASFSRASGGASSSISLTPISGGGSSGGGDDDDDNTEEWDPDNPGGGSGGGSSTSKPDFTGNVTVERYPGVNGPIGSDGWDYGAACIFFNAPVFSGKSTSVDIAIKARYDESTHGIQNIGVALCRSPDNHSLYPRSAGIDVADEYQIAVELMTIVNDGYGVVNIPTTQVESNTPYYIILWMPRNYATSGWYYLDEVSTYRVRVNYTSADDGGDSGDDVVIPGEKSVLSIDNGAGFEKCECFGDNGASWDKYEPYIDNGESWDKCR